MKTETRTLYVIRNAHNSNARFIGATPEECEADRQNEIELRRASQRKMIKAFKNGDAKQFKVGSDLRLGAISRVLWNYRAHQNVINELLALPIAAEGNW
jgi:hypothetical protein